ncbi:MAG: hypothetical protein VX541_13540 [Candidatus Poribacteria bacterium]|nr:hypothetical protein [Candidatus Poribacteria bacterium]
MSRTLPVTPQMAEVTIPQWLVEDILNQIAQLSSLAQHQHHLNSAGMIANQC